MGQRLETFLGLGYVYRGCRTETLCFRNGEESLEIPFDLAKRLLHDVEDLEKSFRPRIKVLKKALHDAIVASRKKSHNEMFQRGVEAGFYAALEIIDEHTSKEIQPEEV